MVCIFKLLSKTFQSEHSLIHGHERKVVCMYVYGCMHSFILI